MLWLGDLDVLDMLSSLYLIGAGVDMLGDSIRKGSDLINWGTEEERGGDEGLGVDVTQ